ncbi:N-acyl amino acid synthase FeeM domain-containing protein [Desulfonatronum thioautotrophicum]|uniref:N-acyl amino acid synthase FeeM domain-containing protein n=1 Tax=Desulfonatronum thioautotrophicum TaxID=617001 RepID=UPI0005EB95D1|nr:hypothetical protein [Desulfonatronum thioautotrophicum]
MESVKTDKLVHERRRTIRIRRSALLKANLDDIDRPSIKLAETKDEWSQAFGLVHKEYMEQGYITQPHPSALSYNIYNFLPSTCVFIFKSYLTVISTLTQIFDSPEFGLPMDALYRNELDELRGQGRKVTELSALATPKEVRWCNLMVYLSKTMFEYSRLSDVNDICIMVNPKHVRFYKAIFLFDDFGEEKFYDAVGAPAVALRLNYDTIEEKLGEVYSEFDFESNLYAFFCKVNSTMEELREGQISPQRRAPMDPDSFEFFSKTKPELFTNLNPEQSRFLHRHYPQSPALLTQDP